MGSNLLYQYNKSNLNLNSNKVDSIHPKSVVKPLSSKVRTLETYYVLHNRGYCFTQ